MRKGPLSKRDIVILLLLVVAIAGVVGMRYTQRKRQAMTTPDLDGLPGLVVFSSDTCYYCIEQKKVLDELTPVFAGRAKFVRLDVYEHYDLFRQLGGQYIPAVLFVDADGNHAEFAEGFQSADAIKEWLASLGIRP